MLSSVRAYDTVGRFGGEEFLIVLPGCDGPSALQQAERLRACMAGEVMQMSEGALRVTVSLGVAVGGPAHTEGELLLRAAAAALYRAKNGGRNRVELATAAEAAENPSPEPPQPPSAGAS